MSIFNLALREVCNLFYLKYNGHLIVNKVIVSRHTDSDRTLTAGNVNRGTVTDLAGKGYIDLGGYTENWTHSGSNHKGILLYANRSYYSTFMK